MTDAGFDWVRLADAALAALAPDERESALVYLVRRIVPAGGPLPWPEGTELRPGEPVALAFVDLEPGVNWTHKALYMVLGAGGQVVQRIEADRPPFLTAVPDDLVLIHRGAAAPAWAAATDRTLDR